jgi:hypothetical protein
MLQLSVERVPRDPTQALASAPPFSRLEHSMTRPALYRLTRAFVAHGIASYPEPPAAIVLDLDHSEAPTHGPPELAFDPHHSQSYCYLPLCIFEGTSHALVTAGLRPGKRPPGRENALIVVRLLAYLRRHWPHPPILVRGDSHCATPEGMEVLAHRRHIDFVFGFAGNAVLRRQAAPSMQEAHARLRQRTALARVYGAQPPLRSRLYEEVVSGAASWAQPWRVLVKAAVMAAGDKPRFVVTS